MERTPEPPGTDAHARRPARAKCHWTDAEIAIAVRWALEHRPGGDIGRRLDRSAEAVETLFRRLRDGQIAYPNVCRDRLPVPETGVPATRKANKALARFQAIAQRLDRLEVELTRTVTMSVALLVAAVVRGDLRVEEIADFCDGELADAIARRVHGTQEARRQGQLALDPPRDGTAAEPEGGR